MAKKTTNPNPVPSVLPYTPTTYEQVKLDYAPGAIRRTVADFIEASRGYRMSFAKLTSSVAKLQNQKRQLMAKMAIHKDKLAQGITKEDAPNERVHNSIVAGRLEADPDYQVMLKEQEFFENTLVEQQTTMTLAKADLDAAREELSATRMLVEMFVAELGAVGHVFEIDQLVGVVPAA